MRRVAITGMGAISAAGSDVTALWEAARGGRCGMSPLAFEHARGNRIRIAASVRDFDPSTFLDEATLRTADRYTQFALRAAGEAAADAGLENRGLAGERTGIVIGTGIGGVGTIDDGCRAYYQGDRFDTHAVPRIMPSSGASHIGIAHGITGPTFTVTSACASATQAIGVAASLVRSGIVDRVVTGGTEACLTPATMRAWEYLRVLSPDACRPFSTGRNGMVIGEGAGIFILEAEDAVRARGGRVHAWLAGYGTTGDACDMLSPDVRGAARAMENALADAGLTAAGIGYVNAHGTGTAANDLNEAEALRAVFGAELDRVPVSSSKPIVGHALGAAGALELAITVMALKHQVVPPQINCRSPDPKCALNLPLDGALAHEFSAALSNSFAFGGINASLVVTRAE
jgi:nodulation protein E